MTSVAALRTRLQASAKAPAAPWQPPSGADFWPSVPVLAFDASLSHTGWLVLEAYSGKLIVHGRGTINPRTDQTGYWQTWEKARQLRAELSGGFPLQGVIQRVVVEAPPVGGGTRRDDSSLIAGMEIYIHFLGVLPVHTVAAQHVAKVLTGRARKGSDARKKAVREAVARYIPGSDGRSWNEHQRDAAGAALTFLYDLAKERAR